MCRVMKRGQPGSQSGTNSGSAKNPHLPSVQAKKSPEELKVKETLAALMLLCAAGKTVPAQPMGDAAFLLQLSQMNANIQAEIGRSPALRTKAAQLTKEDPIRMVLANLAASEVPTAYVQAAFDNPAARFIPEIPARFKPA